MELQQLEGIERHVRALETAYERERQQRDHLEKKYARLKRRFIRLERAHAKLLVKSQATRYLIDLASPTARRSPIQETREAWLSSPSSTGEAAGPALLGGDFCSESPPSSDPSESPARSESMRPTTNRSRRQLDFVWNRDPTPQSSSPPPAPSHTSERTAAFPLDPLPRPRPRPLRNAQSPERRLSTADWGSSQAAPRIFTERRDERLSSSAFPLSLSERLPRSPLASRSRSVSSSSSTAPASSSPSPSRSPTRRDDGEAASLALARYLQEQENIAAYEEYETRLRIIREQQLAREDAASVPAAASAVADYFSHRQEPRVSSALLAQPNDIDPDNMTYEELLQLGEQVGDVKKERWRQMAVQVISRLPTHRWSGDNQADVSCIVCQCSFERNEMALTLPCAHVFHAECVEGWIRENNSCPLCKLEIADV